MGGFSDENTNSEALILSSFGEFRKSVFITPDPGKKSKLASTEDFVAVLPVDVTELVIEKLGIVDYIRFSTVNKLWRSIVIDPLARRTRRRFLQQLPWLVLYKTADIHKFYPGFFSIFNEEHFKLDLPEFSGALCCGSSHGWLIVATYGATSLLNPFTRRRIQLPSSATFPSIDNWQAQYVCRPTYIQKAVLLPPSDVATDDSVANFDVDNCTVVAIHGFGGLAYCRASDQAWIHCIEPAGRRCVVDIVYHNGKLYGLHWDFDLSEIELGSPTRIKFLRLPCPVGYSTSGIVNHLWNKMFLVESCAELLLIVRDDHEHDYEKLPKSFNVFKFDSSNHCWVKLESLGDLMLFVGQHNSISLSASLFPEFEGNCIYFSDQFVDRSKQQSEPVEFCVSHPEACSFVGVFSLATKRVKYFCSIEHISKFQPVWFMPCLS